MCTADLSRYADLVDGEVCRLLADEASPHLGPLVAEYPSRGGKRLRPALLLATCEAFGGDVRDALPAAASLELLHNAFLVHDDLEDESSLRRGGRVLHLDHGVAMAVHAGDALAVRSVVPLLDQSRLSGRVVQRVVREFLDMARRTLEGQAMELAWRDDPGATVELDDYLRLVLHKTCWYTTIYPLRAGCIIGARGTMALGPLTMFGFLLGAAFQVRDDVLNVAGDPSEHGKEHLADIREGKRTVLLVHLLAATSPDERRFVETFLATPSQKRSDADVHAVADLMHQHGSIEAASGWASGLAFGSRAWFDVAFARASPEAREFVEHLIDFVVDRAY